MNSYSEHTGPLDQPAPKVEELSATLGIYPTESKAKWELKKWGVTPTERACLRVCETDRGFEVVRLTYREALNG